MSDDEVLRRRAPFAALAAIIVVIAGGVVLKNAISDRYGELKAFCSATHGGEPWPHVQERAAGKGYEFVRQSREGAKQEEWLTQIELGGDRAGCVVVLEKGRVVNTRFGELP
ncbi:MAG TPA: hypothetical protein VGD87_07490 [Archangium sp.]